MVKPDGTETHEHSVRDFTSNNVIIAGGDMIITGIANIYENAELKYLQVPITIKPYILMPLFLILCTPVVELTNFFGCSSSQVNLQKLLNIIHNRCWYCRFATRICIDFSKQRLLLPAALVIWRS